MSRYYDIEKPELEISTLKSDANELHSLNQESDASINKAPKLLISPDALRNENNYLRDVIEGMQLSTSWKLTAPFRFVGSKLLYLFRVIRKVRDYHRLLGTRAFAAAIYRKVANASSVDHVNDIAYTKSAVSLLNQEFDVVYAIGCWEGESKRYRVYNLADGLEAMGYRVHVMPYEHIASLSMQSVKVGVVVLFRAPFDLGVGIDDFLKYAKRRGIKVIFDVDDLVFDTNVLDDIDGYRTLSDIERVQYIEGVKSYRQLMLAADFVTVPTNYLRLQVEAIGKPAFVIPNSINEAQQFIASDILINNKNKHEFVRVGYFSGSRTHQADFEVCADALLKVMEEFPSVILRIVGYLQLDARWDRFDNRIEKIDFQPYQFMLRILSECDINIAPLDLRSVFCHGKSELKFFEAGLLGIPTLASATDTFIRVIENGVNGFTLFTPAEWKEALTRLVLSEELRKCMGAEASKVALTHFSIQEVSKIARDVYNLDTVNLEQTVDQLNAKTSTNFSAIPTSLDRLRISWVIPGLIIGGGGHRNILRAAYYLTQFGHQVSLYFIGTEDDPRTIKRQIQDNFYPINCPVYLFEGNIRPCDIVFATHWTTVKAALTAKGFAKEIIYFVQDFEPAFAAMGTEYVLAENTYRLGLYHITSGPWCEVMLRRDFHADADHFQFPVDRSIYYPRPRNKSNRNLIFFAKPEMPRRCFELGVMALRELHRIRPDVEIVMFGSKHASKRSYDFPVTIREVLPTLDDLAQLYSDGDVGLVFSTTNPSLIPYEMMACGLPVIDLARGDNAVNYAGRTDIAKLVDPEPTQMAKEIAELIGSPAELADRSENGLVFVDGFPSEEEMALRIENLIFARLASNETANLTHSKKI